MQRVWYSSSVSKKKTKSSYRIRNWSQYNAALTKRGSLTLWVDPAAIDQGLATTAPARRGRPLLYSDAAIRCCLLLREVFHLPLRQTQGLARSLFAMLKLDLPSPHYSLLSRRARHLKLSLAAPSAKPIKHLVFDASGLKVFGEGEWKVRTRGKDYRRKRRKRHIGLDADSQQLVVALLTDADVVDPRTLPRQLKQVDAKVERVYGDGAYDSRACYRAIHQRGARAIIPPRKGSVHWQDDYLKDRNHNLRGVEKHGVEGWKKGSGYHRRSLVETAFFRLKRVFSERLCRRRDDTQATEVMIRCMALNRMSLLAFPIYSTKSAGSYNSRFGS
jgi:Transposase DDE domain